MSELLAFTADHVCRVTGLSRRQLSYWDKTGFFSPKFDAGYARQPFGRIYSFRNLVGLRTIALLRGQVPLQELRKVGQWLSEAFEEPWTTLVFYVVGRRVYFQAPESTVIRDARSGNQAVMPIEMSRIARDTEASASRLTQRSKDQLGKVQRNRFVAHNAAVIAGTRVPTEAVWNFHTAGYDEASIIREYPRLTAKDVSAAIRFEEERRARQAS